jgi:hypothetical protein
MEALPQSFTIKTFCALENISVPMFYKLDQQGEAPDSYYVGTRRLISPEAALRWRRTRERKAKKKAAQPPA